MPQGYLTIPVRHAITDIFAGVEAGQLQADGLLNDEKLGLVPMCIAQGWTVMEMASRLGWSTRQVRDVVHAYFEDRKESIYQECQRERVAVETKVFGEMLRNKAIKDQQYKVAWGIHKGMVETLQGIGMIPRQPIKVEQETKEERTIYVVKVGDGGVMKMDKRDEVIDVEATVTQTQTHQIETRAGGLDVDPYPEDTPTSDDETIDPLLDMDNPHDTLNS